MQFRILLLAVFAATHLAVAGAQWAEVGDAGDLPQTAQLTGASDSCTTALPQISGNLDANDVDMYVICISDPSGFSATTVGGATIDTQLWLFDANGHGVAFNDDSTGVQSTITHQFVLSAGTYLLAVSQYNRDATDHCGNLIWNNGPFDAERAPDGPGAASPVASWVGTTDGGSYVISLTGASAVHQYDTPNPPEPCLGTWDETINGGGDAGDLPDTAQSIADSEATPCETPVERIRGALDEDDVDMYRICVTNPAAFSATTTNVNTFDSQLWLFNEDGTGIAANDDDPGGNGLQSTLTGQYLPGPGTYLLAISEYDRDPRDASGNEIWEDGPFDAERQPDGPGAGNPVAGWVGTTDGTGYMIVLTGAYFVDDGEAIPGDVNGDGCVDDSDLAAVIFEFGSVESGAFGNTDLNDDGVVDDADLAEVIFNFGAGCA